MTVRVFVETELNSGSIDIEIFADDGSSVSSKTYSLTSGKIHRLEPSIDGNEFWFDSTVNGDAILKDVWIDPNPENRVNSTTVVKGTFSSNSIIRFFADNDLLDFIRPTSTQEEYTVKMAEDPREVWFNADIDAQDSLQSLELQVSTNEITGFGKTTSSSVSTLQSTTRISIVDTTSSTASPLEARGSAISSEGQKTKSTVDANKARSDISTNVDITNSAVAPIFDNVFQRAISEATNPLAQTTPLRQTKADITSTSLTGLEAFNRLLVVADLSVRSDLVVQPYNTADGDITVTAKQDTGNEIKEGSISNLSPGYNSTEVTGFVDDDTLDIWFEADIQGQSALRSVGVDFQGRAKPQINGSGVTPRVKDIQTNTRYGPRQSVALPVTPTTTFSGQLARLTEAEATTLQSVWGFEAYPAVATTNTLTARASSIVTSDVETTAVGTPKELLPKTVTTANIEQLAVVNQIDDTEFAETFIDTGSITLAQADSFKLPNARKTSFGGTSLTAEPLAETFINTGGISQSNVSQLSVRTSLLTNVGITSSIASPTTGGILNVSKAKLTTANAFPIENKWRISINTKIQSATVTDLDNLIDPVADVISPKLDATPASVTPFTGERVARGYKALAQTDTLLGEEKSEISFVNFTPLEGILSNVTEHPEISTTAVGTGVIPQSNKLSATVPILETSSGIPIESRSSLTVVSPALTSSTSVPVESRASLTAKPFTTSSNVSTLQGSLTIFGLKSTATATPLLGEGPAFVQPQSSVATPLTAEIIPIAEGAKTNVSVTQTQSRASLSTTTDITSTISALPSQSRASLLANIPDVTTAIGTEQYGFTSLSMSVPGLTQASVPDTLFDSTSLIVTTSDPLASTFPQQGFLKAIGKKTLVTATPKQAGVLSDGIPAEVTATPLSPSVSLSADLESTQSTGNPLELTVNDVTTDLQPDSITSINPTLDSTSLRTILDVQNVTTIPQQPRQSLSVSLTPQSAEANPLLAKYIAVVNPQTVTATPLNGAYLKITDVIANPITPDTDVLTNAQTTKTTTDPITPFLSGSLVTSPVPELVTADPLQLDLQTVTSAPVTKSTITGTGVVPRPSLSVTLPDITQATVDPSVGKLIAIGSKPTVSADPLLGIYIKGIPKEVQATPKTANVVDVTTKEIFTSSTTTPLTGKPGGLLALSITTEKGTKFTPLGGELTNLHVTTAPFDNISSAFGIPSQLNLQALTTDLETESSSVAGISTRSSLIVDPLVQTIDARPLSELTAEFGKFTATPLVGTEKDDITGQGLITSCTTSTFEISSVSGFFKVTQRPTAIITPETPLSFPHTPTPSKQFIDADPLIAEGIAEKRIEIDISTTINANSLLGYELGSISYGTMTSCTTRTIDAGLGMVNRAKATPLTPSFTERLSPGNAFITSSTMSDIQAELISTQTADAQKTPAVARFPVGYHERRSDQRNYSVSYSYIQGNSYPENLNADKEHETRSRSKSVSVPKPETSEFINEFNDVQSSYESERSLLQSLRNSLEEQDVRYWVSSEDGPSGFVTPYADHQAVINSQESLVESLHNQMLSYQNIIFSRTPEQRVVIPEDGNPSNTSTEYAVSSVGAKNDVITQIDKSKLKTSASISPKWASKLGPGDPMLSISPTPLVGILKTGEFLRTPTFTPIIAEGIGKASTDPEEMALTEVEGTGVVASFEDIIIDLELEEPTTAHGIPIPFPGRPIIETHTRPLIPKVEIDWNTNAEITGAESSFPVGGRSSVPEGEHDPPELYQKRENSITSTTSITEETKDLDLGVVFRNLRNLDETYSGEGTQEDDEQNASGGYTTDFISGKFYDDPDEPQTGDHPIEIPEGKWEILPTSNQPFWERLRWGVPELGTGLDFDITVDGGGTSGIYLRDYDSLGVAIEITGEARVVEGTVGVKDRFPTSTKITDSETTDYYTWSSTYAFQEKSTNAEETEIVTVNATPATYYGTWYVNGHPFDLKDISTTWKEVSITFDATREDFVEEIDPVRRESGNIEVASSADGGFRCVDTSAEGCTTRLIPPSDRLPLRFPQDVLVDSVSAKEWANDWDAFEVEMRMMRKRDKTPTREFHDPDSLGDWKLEFSNGTVVTDNISVESSRQARDNKKTASLEVTLNKTQTKTLEESASFLNSVNVEEVTDGDRKVQDYTKDDMNTVYITTPNTTTMIEDGEYVVEDWEVEWIYDTFYKASIDVIKK